MPPRILFVDDDPNVLQGQREALRRLPFTHCMASDATAAMEEFRRGPIAVLVCDERMPGKTGSELIREIAAQYPFTTRILLSGNATSQVVLDAMGAVGAHRFIEKPCPAHELAAAIRQGVMLNLLKRQSARLLEVIRTQIEVHTDGAYLIGDPDAKPPPEGALTLDQAEHLGDEIEAEIRQLESAFRAASAISPRR